MKRYFVHRYDVVRVKVAVEAADHRGAMEAADAYLAENHPIAACVENYRGVADEDVQTYPTWLHFEDPGQEVTGYLVDEVGDEQYRNSKNYEADMEPMK